MIGKSIIIIKEYKEGALVCLCMRCGHYFTIPKDKRNYIVCLYCGTSL